MPKFHVEATQVVRAPVEKVFAAATDYESVPKWSKFYTQVHVTKRDGNIVYTEVKTMGLGTTVDGTAKNTETPGKRLETEGEGKNTYSKVVLTFESIPEGTKLTYVADAEVKGGMAAMLGSLAKERLESLIKEEGRSFAKYVEENR